MRKSNLKREVFLVVGRTGQGKSFFIDDLCYAYNRVIIYDPLVEYDGKYLSSVEEIEEHVHGNILFRVVTDTRNFDDLCQLVWDEGNILFVVEEGQRIVRAGNARISEQYSDLISIGRHREVSLIIVAPQASMINHSYRAQVDKIYAFQQILKKDVEYLQYFSDDETIQTLPNLKHREYLEINSNGTVQLKTS